MSDLGETIVTLTTRLTQAERGATAAAHHNSRAAAAMKVKVDNASSDAAALRQRMDAGQSALGEHSKLLKRLMRKFKRTHSLGNMQLLSALKKRVRVQRVQRLKLQKQKQQHLRLAKQLKALTGKAYLHDRRIALETRRLARLDDSTTDSFAQQARVITELQDAVHGLASQMSMQNQQHQQQSAAQAARIGQLEQQLWATSGLQSELQTLQSVFNMQQDVHQQDLECLRGQLEAASGERSELSRRQVEADAGLRSQVQLAHQATEDLAAQLKVSFLVVTTYGDNKC